MLASGACVFRLRCDCLPPGPARAKNRRCEETGKARTRHTSAWGFGARLAAEGRAKCGHIAPLRFSAMRSMLQDDIHTLFIIRRCLLLKSRGEEIKNALHTWQRQALRVCMAAAYRGGGTGESCAEISRRSRGPCRSRLS